MKNDGMSNIFNSVGINFNPVVIVMCGKQVTLISDCSPKRLQSKYPAPNKEIFLYIIMITAFY